MPSSVVKSFAKKSGKSVDEVEDLWKKAKGQARKSAETNSPRYFALATGILKKMLKVDKKESITNSLLDEATMDDIKREFDRMRIGSKKDGDVITVDLPGTPMIMMDKGKIILQNTRGSDRPKEFRDRHQFWDHIDFLRGEDRHAIAVGEAASKFRKGQKVKIMTRFASGRIGVMDSDKIDYISNGKIFLDRYTGMTFALDGKSLVNDMWLEPA